MALYAGDIASPLHPTLHVYYSSITTFIVKFSGLPTKDRAWLLPAVPTVINKKVTTFAKCRVLWSLSMEE